LAPSMKRAVQNLSVRTISAKFTKENVSAFNIPLLPRELVAFLGANDNYLTKGIFRVPGSNAEIQTIIKLYKKKRMIDLTKYKIHSIASALKQWLRSQSQPIMTFEYYDCWIKAIALPERHLQLAALQKVIKIIPEQNRAILEQLFELLRKIHKHRKENLMSATNLAIVFSPALMWSKRDIVDPLVLLEEQAIGNRIIELFVKCFHTIFKDARIPVPFKRDVSIQQNEFLESLQLGSLRVASRLLSDQQENEEALRGVKFVQTPEQEIIQFRKEKKKASVPTLEVTEDTGSFICASPRKDFMCKSDDAVLTAEKIRSAVTPARDPVRLRNSTPNLMKEKKRDSVNGSPIAIRRRTLLRQRISDSSFSDDILQEARERVQHKQRASTLKVNGPSKSPGQETKQEQIEYEISYFNRGTKSEHRPRAFATAGDLPQIKQRNSLIGKNRNANGEETEANYGEVLQEILLGILSGNIVHVKEYVSLFESGDCVHLQELLKEMENKRKQ